jgi:hypothetical protein
MFLRDEGGAETVEYVLVTLALLVPTAFVFKDLYYKVLLLMQHMLTLLQH